MSYEIDTIRQSQEIFYQLLKKHEISEEKDSGLFRNFAENEAIQTLVRSQGEASGCDVERYGDVIYLIPKEDNTYLGYSKAQLKTVLCRSGATDKDYYLAQFTILVLLVEFYDGQGSSSKTRDFMRVGELQNCVAARLKEGADRETENSEEREDLTHTGLAFGNMLVAYEALRSDERGSRAKTTKEGFMHHILMFLQNQGLIEYVERDETVMPTKKLDNLMDWNILNQKNYQRVRKVLGEQQDGNN